MRSNLLLSAASLLCVLLYAEAGLPNIGRYVKPIQLSEGLVERLLKNGQEMRDIGVTLHPGIAGNGTGPRREGRAMAECGTTTVLSSGESVQFQSPRYPSNYPARQNCIWNFESEDADLTLLVECDSFDVRGSKKCKGDMLMFQETVDNQFTMSTSFCGKHSPLIFDSLNSELQVTFLSNRRRSGPGFSCIVSVEGSIATTTEESQTTAQPGESDCECGQVNRNSRIVGGEETEVNEYPWHTGIVSTGYSLFCGGSVIDNQWVLTAAHCVDGGGVGYVLVGDHDYTQGGESEAVLIEVSEVIMHEDYNSNTVNNDIALLRLAEPLNFSQRGIGPVCLPSDDSKTYAGETATVTGWGRTTEGGSSSRLLLEVDVPVITNSKCNEAYNGITEQMLCAGVEEGGKDSCQGDSGGPMVYQDGNHYDQIGVVSFGRGCARPEIPGVYARVTEYLGWISEKTAKAGYSCSS